MRDEVTHREWTIRRNAELHLRPFLLIVVFAIGRAVYAEPLPPLPSEMGFEPIPAFSFADEAAAQAAWRPREDSRPVSLEPAGPRQALRMPCAFRETQADRASWDWRVKLDMSECEGMRFRFLCTDPSPVAYFTVHLRSGEGWYQATFTPSAPGTWTTVEVDKASARAEGKPSGWTDIDLIRISAWRGSAENTDCAVADFGVEGAPPIGLLWNESTREKTPAKLTDVRDYTLYLGSLLDDLGLSHAVVSDLDAGTLDDTRLQLLFMPYCPNLGQEAVAKLREFVLKGGKIVSFYEIPSELASDLGFRTTGHVKQAQPGDFAFIRPVGSVLAAFPKEWSQASWNILDAEPIEGRGEVAARWHNAQGQDTGHNAVLVSDTGIHVTHTLLTGPRSERLAFVAAAVCRFAPQLWPPIHRAVLERAQRVGSYKGIAEFKAALPADADKTVGQSLDRASTLLAQAQAFAGEDKHAEALATAEKVHDLLLRTYCDLQEPTQGEYRAFWCHNAYGVPGMTWDEAVKLLADNGFTSIQANMLWGGVAYYKSEVLPVAAVVEPKGDPLAACMDACKRNGIQCHVWKVNLMLGSAAPKDFVDWMQQENRLQVDFGGTTNRTWLCPSHPDNRELEAASLEEVTKNYDVDGIHLDYIRYPDANACFCNTCRTQFEAILGHTLPDWPRSVREDPAVLTQWLEFRRSRITSLVAEIAKRVREAKPGIAVSAAVWPDWQRERDVLGQDWKEWCDKGYVDFVCPINYTTDEAQFRAQVKQQLAWAGKVPCYPGIGLSTWARPDDIERLIAFITAARTQGTKGFTVFNYSLDEAKTVVPLCGLGITQKQPETPQNPAE